MIVFPYGTKHFHLHELMKQFLCGAHLNFGNTNSTHKVYHINKSLFNFFLELGAAPKYVSMLYKHTKNIKYIYTKKILCIDQINS